MNIKFIAVLVAFLFIQDGSLNAQILNPVGDTAPVKDEEIWAQTLQGSHYNEFWNYQFYLNDGITVHIAFTVANFGSFKEPVSGVQVSIYNLGGELYQVSREYPIYYLVQDKDEYMFQLRDERDIYFRGKLPDEHQVRVRFSKNEKLYDIDLTLYNIHRGLKWDDGLFHVRNENVGIITHIPYAEVRGHVAVNDIRSNVTGTAFMDHTFQNQTTTDLFHSGYRFVYQSDKQNWDMLYFLIPKNADDRQTIGYRLMKQENRVSVKGIDRIDQITDAEAFGENIARILDLKLEDQSEVRISRTADFEKFSVLSELGWFAKRAAKSYLGGEVINIRGEAILMEPGHRPKNGYYNFYKID